MYLHVFSHYNLTVIQANTSFYEQPCIIRLLLTRKGAQPNESFLFIKQFSEEYLILYPVKVDVILYSLLVLVIICRTTR